VVALVRSPERAQGLRESGVVLHQGDITDKESMREGMRGVDGVYHVAGWYKIGARDKRPAEAVNVNGTRNVLELMRELDIPKGVYTSTNAVFSDTHGQLVDETYKHNGPLLSEYDRTKCLAHYMVAGPAIKQGLPLVIVQPGVVYGPGDEGPVSTAVVQYLRGGLPAIPRGTAYSWGHVEDTARGHIQAMEKGCTGESYIIAGPPHTLIEAFDLAEAVTGIKAPTLRLSPGLFKAASALAGLVEGFLPLPETFRSETLRVGAGATYLGSSAKAERELGFKARPFAEGWPDAVRDKMRRLRMAPQGN
jgi:nucleoside-diphosphate-sugar epimerase